jgi:hypothetical protein
VQSATPVSPAAANLYRRGIITSPAIPRDRLAWLTSLVIPQSQYSFSDSLPTHLVAMSNFQLPAGMRPASSPSNGASPGGNGPSPEERAAAEERASQQAEMKRSMIAAMLEPAARERRECECGAAGLVPSWEHLIEVRGLRKTTR